MGSDYTVSYTVSEKLAITTTSCWQLERWAQIRTTSASIASPVQLCGGNPLDLCRCLGIDTRVAGRNALASWPFGAQRFDARHLFAPSSSPPSIPLPTNRSSWRIQKRSERTRESSDCAAADPWLNPVRIYSREEAVGDDSGSGGGRNPVGGKGTRRRRYAGSVSHRSAH